jgi:hypothetical protein
MSSRRASSTHDPADQDNVGSVPPDNEPGHHPDVEQDKPIGRRPRPRTAAPALPKGAATSSDASPPGGERFDLHFDGPVGVAARVAVVHEDRAYVELTDDRLVARFGPWVIETTRANIADATVTGPYQWWKVAGPPHLSFADRGLTFGTNAERGVCITFREPVPGIEPTGRIRHPGLTVTVADPEALVKALHQPGPGRAQAS